MMLLKVFLAGFIFSFLGSIPPGTLNLAVLQLGLEHKIKIALRFTLAVAIIEYPYAWIAVVFEDWVTSSPLIVENFQLITAVVMTVIGGFTVWSARKPSDFSVRFNASGFRRGVVLSILNPMAIPFWIGITAYLKAQGWIDLSTPALLHSYVFGTSIGVLALLFLFIFLAKRLSPYIKDNRYVKLVPGFTLLVLGLYAFAKYLLLHF
ncbi:MAG: LysE family transporter [Cyclobacteriaceae bacterium]|nr:LysE family transporter [Cyclobacteriaceae bacterium]